MTEISPATSWKKPSIKDLRLWVGVALISGAILVGSLIFQQQKQTVPVWVAANDLTPGRQLSSSDFMIKQLRFTDQALADKYLSAAQVIPEQVGRFVAAGELVPRAVLAKSAELVEVSLAVPVTNVPLNLTAGDKVDVWLVAPEEQLNPAKLVLAGVLVLAVPSPENADFAPQQQQQIVIGVNPQVTKLAKPIAATQHGTLVLTR